MFSRHRSRTKMGDMAQIRKEIDDAIEKLSKVFEKSLDQLKQHEKVREFHQRVQNATQKIRQDLKKKLEGNGIDIVQIRREFDCQVHKMSLETLKDLPKIKDIENEVKERAAKFYDDIIITVSKKIEEFHVHDETIRIRIEIERKLSELSAVIEKECDKVKDNQNIKEYVKQFKKINENMNKEIGKRLDDFKNDRIDVQKDVRQMLRKIFDDFKRIAKSNAKNDNMSDIFEKLKTGLTDINMGIGERLEKMRRNLNHFKISDELNCIKTNADKSLNSMVSDFQSKIHNVETENTDAVDKILKTFASIADKMRHGINNAWIILHNDRLAAEEKVKTLLRNVSSEFHEQAEKFQESAGDVLKHAKSAVEEVSKKASADVANLFDELKRKVREFENEDKVVKARKEVENIFLSMRKEVEKDFNHLKENQYIKEAIEKFAEIHDEVNECLNGLMGRASAKRDQIEDDLKTVIQKMSGDFDKAVANLRDNSDVQNFMKKVNESSAKLAADFCKALKDINQEAKDILASVKNEATGVTHAAEKAADTLTEKTHKIADDAEQTVSKAVHNIQKIAQNAVGNIQEVASEIVHEAEETLHNVWDKASSLVHGNTIDNNSQSILTNKLHTTPILGPRKGDNWVLSGSSMTNDNKINKGNASPIQSSANVTPKKIESIAGKDVRYKKSTKNNAFEEAINGLFNFVFILLGLVVFAFKSIPAFLSDILLLVKPKSLDKKIVVITGTGSGLGKSLAKKFTRLGAKVACVDVNTSANEGTVEDLLKKVKCHTCVRSYICDVSRPENCKKLAKEILEDFGKVDILVNAVSVNCQGSVLELDDASIQNAVQINLNSSFWLVRAFLPNMIARKEGQIVLINSMSAFVGQAMASIFSASKAGLLAFAYSLESELRKRPDLEKIIITSAHPSIFANGSKGNIQKLLPACTAEDIADSVLYGIRCNLFVFSAPNVYIGYIFASFCRLLPSRLFNYLQQNYL